MLDSPWFWVHVSSLLFAYASFELAGVLGLTYMVQFKEIKKKHLDYFYTRLPSLQTLDVMNSRAVAIRWLFLTVGVVVGAIWTAQARVAAPNDPNLQLMALNDPKIFVAVLTWAVYSFAVFSARWAGRGVAPPGSRRSGSRSFCSISSHQLLRHDQPYVPVIVTGRVPCISSFSA